MSGSKMTSITSEEIQAAVARSEDRSDWERIRREAQAGIEPADDMDSPDATELMREAIAKRRAERGNKEQVAIRFDHEILSAFRAGGQGWQARMNNALRDWLKNHSPA